MQNPFATYLPDINNRFKEVMFRLQQCPAEYKLRIIVFPSHNHLDIKRMIINSEFFEDSDAPAMELIELHTFLCNAIRNNLEFEMDYIQ